MRRHNAPLHPTPWPAPIEWSCRSLTTIAFPVPLDVIATGKETIAEFGSEADAARAVECVNACAGMEHPGPTIDRVCEQLRSLVVYFRAMGRTALADGYEESIKAMGRAP